MLPTNYTISYTNKKIKDKSQLTRDMISSCQSTYFQRIDKKESLLHNCLKTQNS